MSNYNTAAQHNLKLRFLPFILLFSLIASCVEIDVTIPGFPQMAYDFATSEASIQSTLSYNFLGFCLSCLFFGPLSDSYGRRSSMVFGFLLFFLGSVGCVLAPSLNYLYLVRFIQGFGSSAVWVIAFTIIADIYQGEKALKFIGIMNSVITAAMAIAPIMGSFICDHYGWRATYILVAALSFLSFVSIYCMLPETNQHFKPLNVQRILGEFRTLITDYNFMLHCLAPSVLCASYMAYVASASFLYIDQLGMSFSQYALHQSLVVGAFAVVSLLASKAQARLGTRNTIIVGLIVCVIGLIALLPLAYLFPDTAAGVTTAMVFYSGGVSLCFAVIFSKSMEIFPELKGSASALLMGFRVILCSIGVWFAGAFYTGELAKSALAVTILATAGIINSLLTLMPRFHAQPET